MARDLETGKEERSGRQRPYLAALRGDWDDMKLFFDKYPELLLNPLTIHEDTAFHIAAYNEEKELLEHFVELEPRSSLLEALNKKNKHGNNTFHEVAMTERVDTAEFLVNKLQQVDGSRLKEMLEVRNKLGETPIYRAVAHGQTKMAKYFATKVGDLSYHFRRNDEMSILHIAVIGQHFDTAIWLLEEDQELAKLKVNELTCLHLLARMPSAFRSTSHMTRLEKMLYYWIPFPEDICRKHNDGTEALSIYHRMWRGLAKEWSVIQKLREMKIKHILAFRLTRLLVKADSTLVEDESFIIDDKTISLGDNKQGQQGKEKQSITIKKEGTTEGEPSQTSNVQTPLLIAASEGIEEIFSLIILGHPKAIEQLGTNEENILHVAIGHRQKEIFSSLMHVKNLINCRLVTRINKNGYTLLHQVAGNKYYQGGEAGPAFQLQEELKWLERVRKIMPTHYVMHHDEAGYTADELFKKEHSLLLKEAQVWIKDTSQSCSAVAVLVATVVYAAAYQLPGGTSEKGYPRFLGNGIFVFFTIMDVVSLASSLTSVVMFLSILSSSFEYKDFLRSLPLRLGIGFSLLFISVTTNLLSFAATIFLLVNSEKKTWTWTNDLIYAAAFLPVSIIVFIQLPFSATFTKGVQIVYNEIVRKLNPGIFIPRFLRNPKPKTQNGEKHEKTFLSKDGARSQR